MFPINRRTRIKTSELSTVTECGTRFHNNVQVRFIRRTPFVQRAESGFKLSTILLAMVKRVLLQEKGR